ncbi:unnamed protein product, partial [Prorocentrum cordatum]
ADPAPLLLPPQARCLEGSLRSLDAPTDGTPASSRQPAGAEAEARPDLGEASPRRGGGPRSPPPGARQASAALASPLKRWQASTRNVLHAFGAAAARFAVRAVFVAWAGQRWRGRTRGEDARLRCTALLAWKAAGRRPDGCVAEGAAAAPESQEPASGLTLAARAEGAAAAPERQRAAQGQVRTASAAVQVARALQGAAAAGETTWLRACLHAWQGRAAHERLLQRVRALEAGAPQAARPHAEAREARGPAEAQALEAAGLRARASEEAQAEVALVRHEFGAELAAERAQRAGWTELAESTQRRAACLVEEAQEMTLATQRHAAEEARSAARHLQELQQALQYSQHMEQELQHRLAACEAASWQHSEAAAARAAAEPLAASLAPELAGILAQRVILAWRRASGASFAAEAELLRRSWRRCEAARRLQSAFVGWRGNARASGLLRWRSRVHGLALLRVVVGTWHLVVFELRTALVSPASGSSLASPRAPWAIATPPLGTTESTRVGALALPGPRFPCGVVGCNGRCAPQMASKGRHGMPPDIGGVQDVRWSRLGSCQSPSLLAGHLTCALAVLTCLFVDLLLAVLTIGRRLMARPSKACGLVQKSGKKYALAIVLLVSCLLAAALTGAAVGAASYTMTLATAKLSAPTRQASCHHGWTRLENLARKSQTYGMAPAAMAATWSELGFDCTLGYPGEGRRDVVRHAPTDGQSCYVRDVYFHYTAAADVQLQLDTARRASSDTNAEWADAITPEMVQQPVPTAAHIPPHARWVVGAIITEHTNAFAHEIHHGTPESITKAAKPHRSSSHTISHSHQPPTTNRRSTKWRRPRSPMGLRGTQFGYKHTAGAELVHKHVSTALHVRPDYAVLSLDAADAFHNLSRVYINGGIDAHCPKLRRWARGFLRDAGQVVYRDTGGRRHIWNQTTSIFQGCGMATALFCLGLDRALERAKHQLDPAGIQHELFGYIDDLTILTKPEDLPTIYAAYTNTLSQAGDMTWHMRATGVPAQTATQLDADLLSTLEELVQKQDLTAEQKEKYWHPVAWGGLGFQSVSAVRLYVQAASRALCEKPVLQRLGLRDRDDLLHYCPGLRPAPHRLQSTVNALTQEAAAQQAPDTEPPDTAQRRFTRHRRHAEWTQWPRRTQTELHQRAWALSTTGKGAGAWLGPPTRPDHHLADARFRMAVRHRLGGLVRAVDGLCPFRKEDGTLCAGTVDTKGRHALCCSYGGFAVQRRNNLRDTIARALREAGICDVAVEPWIRPPTGPGNPGLRADLMCTGIDGQLAEQAKRRKYNGVAGFQPLGFEVSGAMGESTRKWLAQQVLEGPGRQGALSTRCRSIATCVVREAHPRGRGTPGGADGAAGGGLVLLARGQRRPCGARPGLGSFLDQGSTFDAAGPARAARPRPPAGHADFLFGGGAAASRRRHAAPGTLPLEGRWQAGKAAVLDLTPRLAMMAGSTAAWDALKKSSLVRRLDPFGHHSSDDSELRWSSRLLVRNLRLCLASDAFSAMVILSTLRQQCDSPLRLWLLGGMALGFPGGRRIL